MSENAPPEGGLAEAREELKRRGYLRPGGETSGRPVWSALRVVVLAALASLVLAVGQVSAARAEPVLVVLLLAAYLPLFAIAFGLLARTGDWLARVLLRLGGEPGVVAGTLAGCAGVASIILVFALLSGTTAAVSELLPGVATSAAFGVAVAVVVRRALFARLAYRAGARSAGPSAWIAPVTVFLGAFASLLWAGRPGVPPAEADAAFPPASGRVAVIAVDGLSREELDAVQHMPGGFSLSEVAAWGWAPLEGLGGRLPAVAWTTIACGVEPARHGVVELEEVRLFGARRGVSISPAARTILLALWRPLGAAEAVARPALARRAATFWEMASRAGCPVTVGGWWGSWPVRRLLGEVASERAWLAGDASPDAASPALADIVREGWTASPGVPAATDRLAVALAHRLPAHGAHLLAVSLPALDLEQRGAGAAPPLVRLAAAPAHLAAISKVATSARVAGHAVWLLGIPWHGGTPFVAASTAPPGRQGAIDARELAGTWLDQLGLPTPAGAPPPRRALSGIKGTAVGVAAYGPPPPPLVAPPPAALATQREVLRSLGYLR